MRSTHGTLALRPEGAVLFVEIDAPPLNLLGPELVSDLVELIRVLDVGEPYKVAVLASANPEFFVAHVDIHKVAEYRAAAASLTGEASIALLFRRLSRTRAITIAQLDGRARGAGCELAMACDLRFAARETALLSQNECAFGLVPGGGGIQMLTRLMGRGRALEVLLTADDYDAQLAERYGWVNRAMPRAELGAFVSTIAHRIARLPTRGLVAVKTRVNEAMLASDDAYRADSLAFGEGMHAPDVRATLARAVDRGFGTSREAELRLGALLGDLAAELLGS